MKKSSVSRQQNKLQKLAKPYEGFPLFAHATGRWAKKIRGKFHYFDKWDAPQAALEKFNSQWPSLSKGRPPPPSGNGEYCTLQFLCNDFLNSKRQDMEGGELSPRTFLDYHRACKQLVDYFGSDRRVDDLPPSEDFKPFRSHLAQNIGVKTLRNRIVAIPIVLKYAFDQRFITEPVHYGQSFTRPSAKMLRKARNASGPNMFEADELKIIIEAAKPVWRAIILLGINCGFGNTDVATLPQSAVDLNNRMVDFPRPKTEIRRRVPLWPETVEALIEAIKQRPKAKAKEDDGLCFLTTHGKPWVRVKQSLSNPDDLMPMDSLSQRFRILLNKLNINGSRGFYCLRHTFETIGGESKDQVAVNAIMGHIDSSMAGVYRESISDQRLEAVVQCVWEWLWPADVAGSE